MAIWMLLRRASCGVVSMARENAIAVPCNLLKSIICVCCHIQLGVTCNGYGMASMRYKPNGILAAIESTKRI